jgi:hypothetical protein
MTSSSPLQDLLLSIESALHLKKRDLQGRLDPIEAALAAYRLAVETEQAREYASAHNMPQPRGAVLSTGHAAARLAAAVAELPELAAARASTGAPPSSAATPTLEKAVVEAQPASGVERVLPKLVRAVGRGRLVVIGALSGRTRTLPEPLGSATDFIDTARDGVHAVSGVPQRIREHRIVGVIICEQIIAHQHSEPVVQAARAAHVPVTFAGKGGNGALARALEALESQLPA